MDKREEVFRAILRERSYQDFKHGGVEVDKERPVSDWIDDIRFYTTLADCQNKLGRPIEAVSTLRCVAALAAAAMEFNEFTTRDQEVHLKETKLPSEDEI
jgi:hypothetical protein